MLPSPPSALASVPNGCGCRPSPRRKKPSPRLAGNGAQPRWPTVYDSISFGRVPVWLRSAKSSIAGDSRRPPSKAPRLRNIAAKRNRSWAVLTQPSAGISASGVTNIAIISYSSASDTPARRSRAITGTRRGARSERKPSAVSFMPSGWNRSCARMSRSARSEPSTRRSSSPMIAAPAMPE